MKGGRSVLKRLDGYKTVLAAVAMLLYAVCGYALGYVEGPHAWEVILGALAVLGIRDAVRKSGPLDYTHAPPSEDNP